jgi:hypothetical protein
VTFSGVSASVRSLLEIKYLERYGGLDGYTFSVFTTTDFKLNISNIVSLFLYRIDVDASRRHYEYPRTKDKPASFALGLYIHYILTVWSTSAIGEQQMLSRCMEILDEYAILSGSMLDTNTQWQENDAIRICLESMTNEDMLRLWDSFEPPYHLSVPYLVRPLRLSSVIEQQAPYVENYTNIYIPRKNI